MPFRKVLQLLGLGKYEPKRITNSRDEKLRRTKQRKPKHEELKYKPCEDDNQGIHAILTADHGAASMLSEINNNQAAKEFVLKWTLHGRLQHLSTSRCSVVFASSGHIFKVFMSTMMGQTHLHQEASALDATVGITGVVQLLAKYSDADITIFVFENLGSDAQTLINRDLLTGSSFQKMLRDIPIVLEKLHNRGWSHGDVKPSNMVFNGIRWHLIDFGFAKNYYRRISRKSNTVAGTIPFMLPQIGAKHRYNLPNNESVIPVTYSRQNSSQSKVCEDSLDGEITIDHNLAFNADRYAFAISILQIIAWPSIPDACVYCVHEDVRCLRCMRHHLNGIESRFIFIPLSHFLEMRVGRISVVDGKNFAWPYGRYPKPLQDAIWILIDFVFQFVQSSREYLVWDTLTASSFYAGKYTDPSLLEAFGILNETPDQTWQKFLRLVNQL